jgi:hypothetical protein
MDTEEVEIWKLFIKDNGTVFRVHGNYLGGPDKTFLPLSSMRMLPSAVPSKSAEKPLEVVTSGTMTSAVQPYHTLNEIGIGSDIIEAFESPLRERESISWDNCKIGRVISMSEANETIIVQRYELTATSKEWKLSNIYREISLKKIAYTHAHIVTKDSQINKTLIQQIEKSLRIVK